jgi:hypothetical protein
MKQYPVSGKHGQGPFKFPAVIPASLKSQFQTTGDIHQLPWHTKQEVPDAQAHPFPWPAIFPFSWQGYLFKPVHQIVGKHHEFKPQAIARPCVAGDRVQTVAVDALLDKVLTAGPLVVSPPYIQRSNMAIGGDDLVVVSALRAPQEPQLLGWLLLRLQLRSNHHCSTGDLFPSPSLGSLRLKGLLHHQLEFSGSESAPSESPSEPMAAWEAQ